MQESRNGLSIVCIGSTSRPAAETAYYIHSITQLDLTVDFTDHLEKGVELYI